MCEIESEKSTLIPHPHSLKKYSLRICLHQTLKIRAAKFLGSESDALIIQEILCLSKIKSNHNMDMHRISISLFFREFQMKISFYLCTRSHISFTSSLRISL